MIHLKKSLFFSFKLIAIFILLLQSLCVSVSTAKEASVTLYITGNIKGALAPCDCPLQPWGGIGRISSFFQNNNSIERNSIIIDAGNSSSRISTGVMDKIQLDLLRTKMNFITQMMSESGYDVFSIGESELQAGIDFLLALEKQHNFNFLLSNMQNNKRKSQFLQIQNQKIGNINIGIVNILSPSAQSLLMQEDFPKLKLLSASNVLKSIFKRNNAELNTLIVVSHLRHKENLQLIKKFPTVNILVETLSNSSQEAHEKVGETLLIKPYELGRQIIAIKLRFSDKRLISSIVDTIQMDKKIIVSSDIDNRLSNFKTYNLQKRKKSIELTFFTPFPPDINRESILEKVVQDFQGTVHFNTLYYLQSNNTVSTAPDSSKNNMGELQRVLCLQSIDRDKSVKYLKCRQEGILGTPWKKCLEKAGISLDALNECIASKIPSLLIKRSHYIKQRYENISSPLIFINKQAYTGRMNPLQIRQAICQELHDSSTFPCNKIPECFSNKDCYREKVVSICSNAGTEEAKCVYYKAVSVPLTVIVPSSSFRSNQRKIIKITRQNFPGIAPKYVSASSKLGLKLLKKYDIKLIPAYIFEPSIKKTYHFDAFKNGFYLQKNKFLFQPARVGSSIIWNRKLKKHNIAVFFRPFSEKAILLLHDLHFFLSRSKIDFHYTYNFICLTNRDGKVVFQDGKMEKEETFRELAILNHYPNFFKRYIFNRFENFDTTYWDDVIIRTGLDPKEIKKIAISKETKKYFWDNLAKIKELPMLFNGDFFLLINNKEIIVPRDESDLEQLLSRLERE